MHSCNVTFDPLEIKRSRCLRKQMIKHTFCRSINLIAVANTSTGNMLVTNLCLAVTSGWMELGGHAKLSPTPLSFSTQTSNTLPLPPMTERSNCGRRSSRMQCTLLQNSVLIRFIAPINSLLVFPSGSHEIINDMLCIVARIYSSFEEDGKLERRLFGRHSGNRGGKHCRRTECRHAPSRPPGRHLVRLS